MGSNILPVTSFERESYFLGVIDRKIGRFSSRWKKLSPVHYKVPVFVTYQKTPHFPALDAISRKEKVTNWNPITGILLEGSGKKYVRNGELYYPQQGKVEYFCFTNPLGRLDLIPDFPYFHGQEKYATIKK